MGGNASKKLAAKCTLLSRDEQKTIGNSFRVVSRNSDKIREEDLTKAWGSQIDPRLTQYLANFLFGASKERAASADFQRFAELYVYNVRGTAEERLQATYESLGKVYSESTELPYQLFKEYCESIASTYMKMVKSDGGRRADAWISKGFRVRAQHVQALGESLAASVAAAACEDSVPHSLSVQVLTTGLGTDILLKLLSELVFRQLFGAAKRGADDGSPSNNTFGAHLPSLLPIPEGLESMPDYPAFVDLTHIAWLNSQLPPEMQHKWRFLFSTHIHGESFSTMIGRIVDEGPTVLIIEDHSGYIFGGYATHAWSQGPAFHGSDASFLFTLAPKIRCYPSTGYNDHFQYLNTHQKTMPNGLMMGGQFDYGGIWLDYEFGLGFSAETCSTYRGYRQLSKEKKFKIRGLEVWGVGDRPLTLADEEGMRDSSILDSNSDAKALLRMAGREQHSEGLREPPPP